MPKTSELLKKASEWAAKARAAESERDRALCAEIEASYQRLAQSVERMNARRPPPDR